MATQRKNSVLIVIAALALCGAGVLAYVNLGGPGRTLIRDDFVALMSGKTDEELMRMRVDWFDQLAYHEVQGETNKARDARKNLATLDDLLTERGIDPESIDPSKLDPVEIDRSK